MLSCGSSPDAIAFGTTIFPTPISSVDSESGCFSSETLLFTTGTCSPSNARVVATSAIAVVSLKRLRILLPFTEISGDDVRLLAPNIPLSKRLLRMLNVLLVKLAGRSARVCDTDEEILRIASVMSFSSLSVRELRLPRSLIFGEV